LLTWDLIGGVFEKSAIEEYVFQHNQDPLNGEQLSEDDLIEIQSMTFYKHLILARVEKDWKANSV
jgi:hypothetical protein